MIRLLRPACPNPIALATDYKHPVNKDALRSASHDKCMYCESKVSVTYFGDVEHIKPRERFAELTYEWTNLGYACARCNNAKRNHWNDALPFIDPYAEDPEEHLASVGGFVFHRAGSQRGEWTWRKVELNRGELLERRLERIDSLRAAIDRVMRTSDPTLKKLLLKELELEIADDKPYSMAARAAMKQLL